MVCGEFLESTYLGGFEVMSMECPAVTSGIRVRVRGRGAHQRSPPRAEQPCPVLHQPDDRCRFAHCLHYDEPPPVGADIVVVAS